MVNEFCLLNALDFPTTRNGGRTEVLENSFSIIAATMPVVPVATMNAASPGQETDDEMQQSPTEVSSSDDNVDEETDRTGGRNKRKSAMTKGSSANSRKKTTQKGRK